MPTIETPNNPMIPVVVEKRLSGSSWAMIDAEGSLTLIADVTVPEAEQQFVHLDGQGARALRNLLLKPGVLALLLADV